MIVNQDRFPSDYPVLHDFMYTTLWPDVDGTNVVLLLVGVTWLAHPDRARRLIDELKRVADDPEYPRHRLSELFNRENCYPLVTPANAKIFCASMAETLEFVVERRGAEQAEHVSGPHED